MKLVNFGIEFYLLLGKESSGFVFFSLEKIFNLMWQVWSKNVWINAYIAVNYNTSMIYVYLETNHSDFHFLTIALINQPGFLSATGAKNYNLTVGASNKIENVCNCSIKDFKYYFSTFTDSLKEIQNLFIKRECIPFYYYYFLHI